MEINLTFYVYFNSDNISDPVDIKSSNDLQVSDLLDFFDHPLSKELAEEYKTTLFIIIQRQFSVEYNEMGLYVAPCTVNKAIVNTYKFRPQ